MPDRQDRAASEPPSHPGDFPTAGGVPKVRSVNNIVGDTGSEASSVKGSLGSLSMSSVNSTVSRYVRDSLYVSRFFLLSVWHGTQELR